MHKLFAKALLYQTSRITLQQQRELIFPVYPLVLQDPTHLVLQQSQVLQLYREPLPIQLSQ
jgi:hypothetical protein